MGRFTREIHRERLIFIRPGDLVICFALSGVMFVMAGISLVVSFDLF